MKFSDIPAHESVKEQLRALADSNRLPQAILLEGPAGVGKFMMARAFAQYVHCRNRQEGDSCGKCPSCLQHRAFNHVDTYYSFPVIKKKNKSSNSVSDDWIEQWREFLNENPYMDFAVWQQALGDPNAQPLIYVDESAELMRKVNLTARSSDRIIVIMWLPERLKEECANKLLKLIEEPHDDTMFILVSDNPAAILPTIYSRLRRIEMKRLPDRVISGYLKDKFAVDDVAANEIAHLAEGSITSAIRRMSTSDEAERMLQLYMDLMRSAYQRKIQVMRKWAESIDDLGRERAIKFLEYCERLTGENYIYNLRNPQLVYLNNAESGFSKNFARFINENNVEKIRHLFMEARRDIAGNAKIKIVMFDVAVQMILQLKH